MPITTSPAYDAGVLAAKNDVHAKQPPLENFSNTEPDFKQGYEDTYLDYKKGFKAGNECILRYGEQKLDAKKSMIFQLGYQAAFAKFNETYNQGNSTTREERAYLLGKKIGEGDKSFLTEKPNYITIQCWTNYQKGVAEGRELKAQKKVQFSEQDEDNLTEELKQAYQQATQDARRGLKISLQESLKQTEAWQIKYDSVYKEYTKGLYEGRHQLKNGRSRDVDTEKFINKSIAYCMGLNDVFVEFDMENNNGFESTIKQRGYLLGKKEAKELEFARDLEKIKRSIPQEFKDEYQRGYKDGQQEISAGSNNDAKEGLKLLQDIQQRNLLDVKENYAGMRIGLSVAISGNALIESTKIENKGDDYWKCYQFGYLRYAVQNGFTKTGDLNQKAYLEGKRCGHTNEEEKTLEEIHSAHPDMDETKLNSYKESYTKGFKVGNNETTAEKRKFGKAQNNGKKKAQKNEILDLENTDLLEQEAMIVGYNQSTKKRKKTVSKEGYSRGYSTAHDGRAPWQEKPTEWSDEKWNNYKQGFETFQKKHFIQNNAQIYYLQGHAQALKDIKKRKNSPKQ